MGWDDFKRRNWLFKELDLRTQAFVPGDEIKRFPLYEGLPTVEKTVESYRMLLQLN